AEAMQHEFARRTPKLELGIQDPEKGVDRIRIHKLPKRLDPQPQLLPPPTVPVLPNHAKAARN
ncbi:hypothetical protein FQN49_006363, partial [Arthroderma sp. PD_2]